MCGGVGPVGPACTIPPLGAVSRGGSVTPAFTVLAPGALQTHGEVSGQGGGEVGTGGQGYWLSYSVPLRQ